jgi:dienelactone hydrolase
MCKQITRIGGSALILLAVIFPNCLSGCGGNAESKPSITVTVSPDSANVQARGTQQFTASLTNDSTNSGVTWTVSCAAPPCGSVSPTSTPSDVPTTYTAPTDPPSTSLGVSIRASSVASPHASAYVFVTVPSVTVSVNPNDTTIQAGATQQFTATLNNDPSNSGVAWTLAENGSACSPGCGTIAPSTTISGVPATYAAPDMPPSSDRTITVIATSVAVSAASSSAFATVRAITVAMAPASALLPAGITLPFTPAVGYDPKNQGVAWSLTQEDAACSPACGSLSASTTASGSPTSYTAPATVPAKTSVTLTATSVTDGNQALAATITLSTGTVEIVPYSLDFPLVIPGSTGEPQKITLTNVGSTVLGITGITITGTNASNFSQTNTCATGVGVGMSCTITVTFTPGGVESRTASISIGDTSSDSPQEVSLTGNRKERMGASVESVRYTLADSATAAVPVPSGSEAVGTRVLQLVDSSRQDPFVANPAKRELLVRFWYPASRTQNCTPANYTSPAVWAYFSQLVGAHLPNVVTNSCVDAPITDGVHPVVVFTHGYTGTFTDYTFLFEDLASRGYVVASVDHTGEATAVEFPGGKLVKSKLGSHLANNWQGDDKTLAFAISVRLQDLRFVRNELERLNLNRHDPFAGKLDLSRVAIAGHSLGGTTAFLALEQDVRFRAAVILDGELPVALIRPTNLPVLVVSASQKEGSVDQCRLWNSLRGARSSVNFGDAEHIALSDMVWLADGAIKTGSMGATEIVAAIRDHVAEFLDRSLHERPAAPLLAGPSLDYRVATVLSDGQSCHQP